MRSLYAIAIILITHSSIYTQSVEWVFLSPGEVNNSCTSDSDYGQSIVCYGLQYTPGFTGIASSYGFGYYISCLNGNDPFLSETSCSMDNASFVFPSCANDGIVLFQAGGTSSAGVNVTEGQPIVLHQVCLSVGPNDTLMITFDDITGSEVSGELLDGTPFTDEPIIPAIFEVDDSGFGVDDCQDTTVCSLTFDTNDTRIEFTLNGNGNIVDGTSNSSVSIDSLDVYDEINELCQIEGGFIDVFTKVSLINTYDVYGNGIVDSMAGSIHYITVDTFGLNGSLPFGVNSDSESSVGDVRGYTIEVTFASHLQIMADQLTLNLANVNSSDTVFESAAVEFYNTNGAAYGTALYTGFYASTPDLSGACNSTPIGAAWTGSTIGVYLIDDTTTVNVSSPCNPVIGAVSQDTILVNPRWQAGLDSASLIGGFKITFLAEDVAVPSVLDDGSGTNGDDGIAGNAPTSTNATANSRFLGFTVDGCVFSSIVLSITLIDFGATQINDNVQLDWQFGEKNNHSHFEVQWSSDNINFVNFQKNVLPDSEFRISDSKYRVIHENPISGKNFYRLKMVDYDNHYEYSDVREVTFHSDKFSELRIWPNPIGEYLFLDFGSQLSVNTMISVMNLQGVIIDNLIIPEGESTAMIDFTLYQGNLFFVKIGAKVHKLIRL